MSLDRKNLIPENYSQPHSFEVIPLENMGLIQETHLSPQSRIPRRIILMPYAVFNHHAHPHELVTAANFLDVYGKILAADGWAGPAIAAGVVDRKHLKRLPTGMYIVNDAEAAAVEYVTEDGHNRSLVTHF